MNFAKISYLVIVVLIFTYFTSSLIVFKLNDLTVFDIGQYWSWDFTYKAIIQNYPRIWDSILYSGIFFTIIAFIIPFISKDKKSLYGSARFATFKEIKNKFKLFSKKGIIVGKFNNKLLRFDSQEFVALGAPTRSGKGVSTVIPNLLEWIESVVILDIKKECFDYTSKYRKEVLKQEVFLFDPFSFDTHKYNPLAYIDLLDNKTRDKNLLDFANLLYPLVGNDTTIYFNQQAQNLFIGICYLYKDLKFTEAGQNFLKEYDLSIDFTMCGILKLSEGFEIEQEGETVLNEETGEMEEEKNEIKGFEETYEFLNFQNLIQDDTKEYLETYMNIKSVNERSSVKSSFNAPLMIYRNEPIKSSTSSSDFSLEDLRKKRMTIYIGITPNNLQIAKPILNIFFSQLISLNTQELPTKNRTLKYSLLLLLDEFTSIGYMPILRKAVSYIAGYNIRLMTIFQSISQIEAPIPDGYGKDGAKTLLQNHRLKIFFAPEDEEADILSKRLGDTTVKQKSKSYSNGRGLLEHANRGSNESETKRALMLPQELRELGNDNELITMTNQKPILCKKAFYYKDPYFMDKLKTVSHSLKNIKGLPSKEELEYAVNNNELNIKIKK